MKARMSNSVIEATQGAHRAKLEDEDAKLLEEVEQAHLGLTEADVARSSLTTSNGKLEEECVELHVAVDVVRQEKGKTATNHEA
jgi:hypothetical protein